jgi:hypothetical protein
LCSSPRFRGHILKDSSLQGRTLCDESCSDVILPFISLGIDPAENGHDAGESGSRATT